jgi:hypothetical protein
LPRVKERIIKVKEYREKSKREATKKLAEQPSLFGEIRQPDSDYVLIPRHSSEYRKYIPIAFFDSDSIVSDSCLCVPNATFYHFGVLTSVMHMTWVTNICGRIKGDYRYSNKLVYNNYPWPENPKMDNIKRVKECARKILEIRKSYTSSLSDLYNPLSMPKPLLDAHKNLDKAVDKCYAVKTFNTDLERLTHLFDLYDKITS